MSTPVTVTPIAQIGNVMAGQGAIGGAMGTYESLVSMMGDPNNWVSVIRVDQMADIKRKLCHPLENNEKLRRG